MKITRLLVLVFLLLSLKIYMIESIQEVKSTVLNWSELYEESLALSQEKEKNVLLYFTGSDWCTWCFRLNDEVFVEKEFIDYANDNFILVKLDFPRDIEQSEELIIQNRRVIDIYGVRGFPTIVILDKEGKEIARTGYQQGGAKNYIKHLKSLLE